MSATLGTVTSKDGTRIEYETSGGGQALVLVAGALGTKGSVWQRRFATEVRAAAAPGEVAAALPPSEAPVARR